jgi:hypothetical protein
MAINIHFFQDRNLERMDPVKLFAYFDELENFKIFYTDEYVEITARDKAFGLSYNYYLTKRSRVNDIFRLNSNYVNVNFLLVMPVLIPSFLAKEILKEVQKICKIFELEVYYENVKDIEPFNMAQVYTYFEQIRAKVMEDQKPTDKYHIEHEKLNEICKYQQMVPSLNEYYRDEVDINYYIAVVDKKTGDVGMSIGWSVGSPMIFPPNLSYIHLMEKDNLTVVVNAKDFFKKLDKYLIEVKNFLPDMHLLKGRQAIKTKLLARKLRKEAFTEENFRVIRICDIIDQ